MHKVKPNAITSQPSDTADKIVVGRRAERYNITYRQLIAIKDGEDNAHDMSHVNDNDGRSAAQMACSLPSSPDLDNRLITMLVHPQ